MNDRRTVPLFLLALGFLLLNAFKPTHIDDPIYFDYARHIAQHPLDPYGFELLYYRQPVPANHVLAPPVLPYWWALAIHLFGDNPFLWKLWLWPFVLLLVFALDALARRFAAGLELPLVCMMVLSPSVLPSFNFMLDIPALALSLAGLAVFASAADGGSMAKAMTAGAIIGLAMQTKYTGFLGLGAVGLYALIFRRFRLGLVAAVAAVLIFAAWESLLLVRYGESHFLRHIGQSSHHREIRPLVVFLGGLAPTIVLLGMVGGRVRPLLVRSAMLTVLAGFAIVMLAPQVRIASLVIEPVPYPGSLSWNHMVFGGLGILSCCTIAAALWVLCRDSREPDSAAAGGTIDKSSRFLMLWFGLEVAGYFLMSPFPAGRRFLSIAIVATLLVGRLVARRVDSLAASRRVWEVAITGAILGFVFYAVDFREAHAEKEAIEAASRFIGRQSSESTIWYIGHWGFQFHAERAGMKELVPWTGSNSAGTRYPSGHQIPCLLPSLLHQGDWIVVRSPHTLAKFFFDADSDAVELAAELPIGDDLPIHTVPCFYSGLTPIEHYPGPRIMVQVGRVRRDFVAR